MKMNIKRLGLKIKVFFYEKLTRELFTMDLLLFKAKLQNHYPVVRETVVAGAQIASVMVVLFIHNNKIFVLMTRRSKHLKIHPGEWRFREEGTKKKMATCYQPHSGKQKRRLGWSWMNQL